MRRGAGLALAMALLLGIATPAHAQLLVEGIRPLDFGTLIAGVPKHVQPTDPALSGRFDLRGSGLGIMLITLDLPTRMDGPGSASIPLSFSNQDAGYSDTQQVGNQVSFNPSANKWVLLGNGRRASVFLGATASPSVVQAPGSYSGTVTLSVFVI